MKSKILTQQERDEDDRLASFDDFNGEDIDHLARACAEHKIDLTGLRTLLDHPLAMAAILRAARNQRPLARLATFVANKSKYKSVVDILMRHDQIVREVYVGLSNDSVARMERARELSAKLFIAEKRLSKSDIEHREGRVDMLPLALLSLGTFRDTVDVYEAALRERFDRVWSPDASADMRHKKDRLFEMLIPPRFTARRRRLVRIGLLEVDVVHPDLATLVSHLPQGAELASYEALAAIQRYPHLLDWMRLHPAGGIKEGVTVFGIWLLGMNTGRMATDRALRLGITFDELNRAKIGALKLVRYMDHLSAVDYVPYIIPVSETAIDLDD